MGIGVMGGGLRIFELVGGSLWDCGKGQAREEHERMG